MLDVTTLIVIFLALAFDFINGFHDTAISIATTVSTRVMTPRLAILMAAVLNFAGALVSSEVAKTISAGLVETGFMIPMYVIIAALVAAIVWDLVTWYYGIPSSSSHALIGGLLGSVIACSLSLDNVNWDGVFNKVLIPLVTSPVVGFVLGFFIMKSLFVVFTRATPQFVNHSFAKLQIVSAAWMAFSHGKNDAQKSMGIITLALFSAGVVTDKGVIPWEVMLACATAMAIGTSIGGWRIIKTMGCNMIRMQPINGFAAQTGAAMVIETASHFGMPVSTTHVMSSSILGVGAAKRANAVRWGVARGIVAAWLWTIPVCGLLGAGCTLLFKLFV